jgi:hypothetical protein
LLIDGVATPSADDEPTALFTPAGAVAALPGTGVPIDFWILDSVTVEPTLPWLKVGTVMEL